MTRPTGPRPSGARRGPRESPTDVPSDGAATDVPSDDAATDVPSDDAATDVPSDGAATDVPSDALWSLVPLLRHLEGAAGGRPPIGRSAALDQEIVAIRQVPTLDFTLRDVMRVSAPPPGTGGATRIDIRSFGLFGPDGPMPTSWTASAVAWFRGGHTALVDFAALLSARFVQLRYRVWADGRTITHAGPPEGAPMADRLRAFIGEAGLATRPRPARTAGRAGATPAGPAPSEAALAALGRVPIMAHRARSPGRLAAQIALCLGVHARVESFVPAFLPLAPQDRVRLGGGATALGRGPCLGARARTAGSRICLHVTFDAASDVSRLLPGGSEFEVLRHLVTSALGGFLDVDLALHVPRTDVTALRLAGGGTDPTAPHAAEAAPSADRRVGFGLGRGAMLGAGASSAARPARPAPPRRHDRDDGSVEIARIPLIRAIAPSRATTRDLAT
ncbi:MAG: type VI secretion system baseplate subunit TssG [Shimia sp.]